MNENYRGSKVVISEQFSRILYDYLMEHGFEISEMAQKCGVSYSYVNGLLNGVIFSKKITLMKICKQMNINMTEVIK